MSDAWWPAPYWDIDTGFAALLMLLTAVDAGLGGCFFGIPVERIGAYRAVFGLPAQFTPIGAISIGYSDEPPQDLSSRRKPMAETVHRGRWNGPGTQTSTGSVIEPEPASGACPLRRLHEADRTRGRDLPEFGRWVSEELGL
jgi:hypothetical protein